MELLKQRFSDPKLDKSRGREYMVRLIYCEMLGHDASFAYIRALQFASEPNIHAKKVCAVLLGTSFTCSNTARSPCICMQAAYLALTQFFDHTNELVLLLVNTLLSDLKSDNFVIGELLLAALTSPPPSLPSLPAPWLGQSYR